MDGLPPMAPLELEAYERLIRCGHTDEQTRRWMLAFRRESEAFVRYAISQAERDAEAFRRWLPRLKGFAEECRRTAPAADPERFMVREREEHCILAAAMRKDAASVTAPGGCPHMILVTTTSVGLSAVRDVFAGVETPLVALLEEEWKRFFDDVPIEDRGNWHQGYEWTVRNGLEADPAVVAFEGLGETNAMIRRRHPIGGNERYWIVRTGGDSSLQGDLWKWNGRTAEPIDLLYHIQF